jgi:hypothetical protein
MIQAEGRSLTVRIPVQTYAAIERQAVERCDTVSTVALLRQALGREIPPESAR